MYKRIRLGKVCGQDVSRTVFLIYKDWHIRKCSIHVMLTHDRICYRHMPQGDIAGHITMEKHSTGHVAGTKSKCVDAHAQENISGGHYLMSACMLILLELIQYTNFVSVICYTEFNLLNFMGHIARANVCSDALSHHDSTVGEHATATCPQDTTHCVSALYGYRFPWRNSTWQVTYWYYHFVRWTVHWHPLLFLGIQKHCESKVTRPRNSIWLERIVLSVTPLGLSHILHVALCIFSVKCMTLDQSRQGCQWIIKRFIYIVTSGI